MSYEICPDCGFLYENINFQPCPTCKKIKKTEEDNETEYFFDGEETFKLKKVA